MPVKSDSAHMVHTNADRGALDTSRMIRVKANREKRIISVAAMNLDLVWDSNQMREKFAAFPMCPKLIMATKIAACGGGLGSMDMLKVAKSIKRMFPNSCMVQTDPRMICLSWGRWVSSRLVTEFRPKEANTENRATKAIEKFSTPNSLGPR